MIRALLARVRDNERHARVDRFERASRRSIGAAPPAPAINFRNQS